MIKRLIGVVCRPARFAHSADLTDIAEQFLEEAAIPAKGFGLFARRVDFRDLFFAATIHCNHIALLIKPHAKHHLLIGCGLVERILTGVAREIKIVLRAKLADPSGAAQSALNRFAVINTGLNSSDERIVSDKALMAGDARARRRGQRNGCKRQREGDFAVHARQPFLDATLPLAEQAATPNMPGAREQQASWDKCMALRLIKKLFARDEGRDALSPLYRATVAEARNPDWYLHGRVADTMDGRFEMVAALTALVIARLDAEGDPGKIPAVMLTELFVDDMDGQLRQEGVGDIVVGKHIGKMMAALGGRMEVYRTAIAVGEPNALADALVRNLYRTEHPGDAPLAFTQGRFLAFWQRLAASPLDSLLAGRFA